MVKSIETIINQSTMSNLSLFDIVEDFRYKKGTIYSNLYTYDMRAALSALQSHPVSVLVTDSAVIAVVDRSHYFQLYYWSTGLCLQDINQLCKPKKIVVEFIEKNSTNIKDFFAKAGYETKAVLVRMSCTKAKDFPEIHAPAKFCSIDDLCQILDIYMENFDPMIDRIPSITELAHAIQKNCIICIRDGEKIFGFANITIGSGVTTLNHICVRLQARKLGFGQQLFKSFLSMGHMSKQLKLWVLEDNLPAINLYTKFGFQFENMKNRVMIK